jgi:uncharacterized protein (DUF1330 family)
MATLAPTPEQFKAFTELQDEGPIVMVNLLKFKPDGGRDSYRIYGEKFAEMMMPKGVELVYLGDALMTLIGGEEWDEVVVIRYPSRDSFVEMVRDPAYQEISRYRTEALLDSRLILTKQLST